MIVETVIVESGRGRAAGDCSGAPLAAV